MFDRIQSAIKTRIIFVFLIIHLGLALCVYAFATGDTRSQICLAGVSCLYAGFLFAIFFIVSPLLPWYQRAKEIHSWIQLIIDNLPKIIAAYQQMVEIWHASKSKHSPKKSEKHAK
jgi:hypothetical protein